MMDYTDESYQDNQQAVRIWTVATLLDTEFPEPRWAIPNIIPEGLTIVGGRPKVGKSWFMLQAAWSVATGGVFLGNRATRGDVLYLALEDSPRRLRKRIEQQGIERDASLMFITDFEPLDGMGMSNLLVELGACDYRMIVIDTLSKAIPGVDQKDETVIGPIFDQLQRIGQNRNTAIVVIDHTRKPSKFGNDPVDDIINSTAKTAMADVILSLYKEQGKAGANLKGRGRDIEEIDLKLRWDAITGCWQSEGEAGAIRITERREDILEAIETLGKAQIGEIAKAIGTNKGNIFRDLQGMCDAGIIYRETIGRSVYYEKNKDV